MKKSLRFALTLALCTAVAGFLQGCGQEQTTPFVAAPPGPPDLGPATGLSRPPPEAVVFDLQYRAQTGGANDIKYNSYWGYGASEEETKTNSFLGEVRKKASRLHYVCNYSLPSRRWAAVEYRGRQALALYFDLDADGRLEAKEQIPPTRKIDQGVEFITPDFMQPLQDGGEMLCRILLHVRFHKGSPEPNCIWSPAVLLEGTAILSNQPARLLLYANGPGGGFDKYGSSRFSLQVGEQAGTMAGQNGSLEMLSSLIASESQFYQLTLDGRRSNGLPARVLLVKDTSPTGSLAVNLAGSNSLQSTLNSLYLRANDNEKIFLRVSPAKDRVTLPAGPYVLDRGDVSYGTSSRKDWDVSFTKGPCATVKAGELHEAALGRPTLRVWAIEEKDRYNSQAAEAVTFQQGTRIYLEPRIAGQGGEIFGRFRQATGAQGNKTDRPPRITITGPAGKQLLSQTMEYG